MLQCLTWLSIGTVDSVNTVLRPTFQLAVRGNVIRNNPADGTMAEVKEKWDVSIGIRHAIIIKEELAFFESLELNKNLSWKPLFIVVLALPKTEAGIRKIPMLKKVKDALELEK